MDDALSMLAYRSNEIMVSDEDTRNALWDLNCSPNSHIWDMTKESNDFCQAGDKCLKKGVRRKCLSCRITCHIDCMFLTANTCRTTYGPSDGEHKINNTVNHHLVERRRQDGKCSACQKSFQKFRLDSANYQCSWCKELFHKNPQCISIAKDNGCSLGIHRNVILPPSWIVKTATGFKVTPLDRSTTPLVVLINPKSGGKKGAELMKRFQYLLNPRQVFNVFQSNMEFVSDLFKDVEDLKYLVCGGDGTAGIVMNDLTNLTRSKPLAILPLGTGNDLARTLGWGAGYNDGSLTRIICDAEAGEVSKLDRWYVESQTGGEKFPMNCFNNYFSLGTDAATALAFHNARTQNPSKFQNRIYNKMFYVKVGSIDLVRQAWKDLWECVSLECDGVDFAKKIKAIRPHVILFLNIPRYGAGTLPWGSSTSEDFKPQSFSDGLLEVIGLSSASLAGLHIGGHGERITQCRQAIIKTSKQVPFQIDGEPFTLEPVTLVIKPANSSDVIIRPNRRSSYTSMNDDYLKYDGRYEEVNIDLQIMNFETFQIHIEDVNGMKNNSWPLEKVTFNVKASLNMLRRFLDQEWSNSNKTVIMNHWFFIDAEKKLLVPSVEENHKKIYQILIESHLLILVVVENIDEIPIDLFLPSSTNVHNNSNSYSTKARHYQTLNPLWKSDTDITFTNSINRCNHDLNLDLKSIENPEIVSEGENIPGPICDESLSDDKSSDNKPCYNSRDHELTDGYDTSSSSSSSEHMRNSKFDKKNFRRCAFRHKSSSIKVFSEFPEEKEDPDNYAIILPPTFGRKKKCSQKRMKCFSVDNDDSDLNSLFLNACRNGSLDEVKKLIAQGANVNSRDANGERATNIASKCQNNEVFNYLMNNQDG